MEYNGYYSLNKDRLDLGIDLRSVQSVIIPPFDIAIVDTGTRMRFPLFGSIRRYILYLLFGDEITGIGGLVWPRSRNNYAVLAGVIDPSYRGTIKVKIYNPTPNEIQISPGDRIAQLIPAACFHPLLTRTTYIDENETGRGWRGGINSQLER